MVLVFAFGSNLDPLRMKQRCPSARKVGKMMLSDAALVFRAVADITHRKGSKVPGGLWEITETDERELDRYEGVAQGLYQRWHVKKKIDGKVRRVLFYQMKSEVGICPPSHQYIDTIMRGYRYWGLDLKFLETALEEAYEDKQMTDYLRWRRQRDRPVLAKRDHVQRVIRPKAVHLFEERPRLTEERVWDKIDAAKLGVTNIVRAKRRRRPKLLRKGQ